MPTEPTPMLRTLPVPGGHRWHEARTHLVSEAAPPSQQGTLALTYPLPSGLENEPRPHLTLVRTTSTAFDDTVPDPHAWASRFLQAVVEVISSDRPASQLIRWTDSRVYADIAKRQQRVTAGRRTNPAARMPRQQVASVHVCRVTTQVAEVAARVTVSSRSRAVAARLCYASDHWTCTELVFG